MEKTESPYKSEIGVSTIRVPVFEGTATFVSPAIGPKIYTDIGSQIAKDSSIRAPTAQETAALVHAAYLYANKFDHPNLLKNVRDTIRYRWLGVPNQNLWTSEGVYVDADPDMEGKNEALHQKDLEARLEGGQEIKGVRFAGDGSVRFASKETYTIGEELSPEKAKEDGFVIASYFPKGAEQIAEVSETIAKPVYNWGVTVPKDSSPVQGVSALYENDDRLYLDGDNWYDGGVSYVFGVRA
jgi:hypothetical protein